MVMENIHLAYYNQNLILHNYPIKIIKILQPKQPKKKKLKALRVKCKERNCSKCVNCSKLINISQLPTTSFSGSFLPHLQHSPINYAIDISVRLSIFNLYQ